MILNGGQGRNRTADASLFRAALYQLSYLAGISLTTYRFSLVYHREWLCRAAELSNTR